MAITAKKQLTANWYTPKSQKKEKAPARFKVRPLTGAQFLEVHDDYDARKGRFLSRGIYTALRYGLADWENITDDEGKDLGCSPENYQYIPATELNEVGNYIIDLAELSEDDEKNSE